MEVKVTFNISIDPEKYPNLKKSEIRKLVKEHEGAGAIIDYILHEVAQTLENENFEKGGV